MSKWGMMSCIPKLDTEGFLRGSSLNLPEFHEGFSWGVPELVNNFLKSITSWIIILFLFSCSIWRRVDLRTLAGLERRYTLLKLNSGERKRELVQGQRTYNEKQGVCEIVTRENFHERESARDRFYCTAERCGEHMLQVVTTHQGQQNREKIMSDSWMLEWKVVLVSRNRVLWWWKWKTDRTIVEQVRGRCLRSRDERELNYLSRKIRIRELKQEWSG